MMIDGFDYVDGTMSEGSQLEDFQLEMDMLRAEHALLQDAAANDGVAQVDGFSELDPFSDTDDIKKDISSVVYTEEGGGEEQPSTGTRIPGGTAGVGWINFYDVHLEGGGGSEGSENTNGEYVGEDVISGNYENGAVVNGVFFPGAVITHVTGSNYTITIPVASTTVYGGDADTPIISDGQRITLTSDEIGAMTPDQLTDLGIDFHDAGDYEVPEGDIDIGDTIQVATSGAQQVQSLLDAIVKAAELNGASADQLQTLGDLAKKFGKALTGLDSLAKIHEALQSGELHQTIDLFFEAAIGAFANRLPVLTTIIGGAFGSVVPVAGTGAGAVAGLIAGMLLNTVNVILANHELEGLAVHDGENGATAHEYLAHQFTEATMTALELAQQGIQALQDFVTSFPSDLYDAVGNSLTSPGGPFYPDIPDIGRISPSEREDSFNWRDLFEEMPRPDQ